MKLLVSSKNKEEVKEGKRERTERGGKVEGKGAEEGLLAEYTIIMDGKFGCPEGRRQVGSSVGRVDFGV